MQYLLLTTRMSNLRIHNSLSLLSECGIHPELVFGAEKDNLTKEIEDIVFEPSAGGLTIGEKAVALSHAKCLRLVMESRIPAVIFEDDIRLWHEGGITTQVVKAALEGIPEDTDFCSFSKLHVFNPWPDVHPDNDQAYYKRIVLPSYGNHCYYVSVKFAELFYRHAFPIRCAADVLYAYPPAPNDLVYRHYYRDNGDDGLVWHGTNSIKD